MNAAFLICDSDPPDRARLAVALRQFVPGSAVFEAESGADAIRILRERGLSPSLMFTAYELGDMNAIELLGRLRQLEWLHQPPTLIVDDELSDRAVVNSYRLGASGFLRKPVLAFELREAVREFARPVTYAFPAAPPVRSVRAA